MTRVAPPSTIANIAQAQLLRIVPIAAAMAHTGECTRKMPVADYLPVLDHKLQTQCSECKFSADGGAIDFRCR